MHILSAFHFEGSEVHEQVIYIFEHLHVQQMKEQLHDCMIMFLLHIT